MAKRKPKETMQNSVSINMQAYQNFDTHQAVKSFVKAGMDEPQAEAVIAAIMRSKDHDLSKLVTKEQVFVIEQTMATKEQVFLIEQTMATKEQVFLIEQTMATKEQLSALEQRVSTLDQRMAALEQRMAIVEKTMATKEDISKQEVTIIKWMVGSFIAFSGIIIAAIKLIH